MRVLYLDCFSGISGDMTVGALCDLGVKPSAFEWELSKLEIGDFHLHFERQQRQHISGIKFTVHEGATHVHDEKAPGTDARADADAEPPLEPAHDHDHGDEAVQAHRHPHSSHEPESAHAAHPEHEGGHGHKHEHTHEHAHGCSHAHSHEAGRSYASIRDLLRHSDLSPFVKQHALGIFERIARAEGRIHGVAPEEVIFHEIGALDSIADVVCACVGLEQLGVDRVFVSHLQEGRGWVQAAHGRFPVPAPATLEILSGITLEGTDEPFEMITPTGAAIVAEFGEFFGPMPAMHLEKTGYGIGSRTLPGRPNVLRAVLGEADPAGLDSAAVHSGYWMDSISRLETNLDDLSPEITAAAMEKLLAAGALDVFLTPIQMKKSRPAVQLSVLCEIGDVAKIAGVIFAETTSFGLRIDQVTRLKLERRIETVQTAFGPVSVKLGIRNGEVIQVSPEFDSCRAASERTGQPVRTVFEAARRGYRDA